MRLRRATARTAVVALAASGLVVTVLTLPTSVEPAAAKEPVAETEAEALEQAAETDEPVEVLSQREATREVHANPDGTFTASEHTVPQRTIKDGEWVDIDTNLKVNEDGSLSPGATTVDMRFSGGGDDPLVKVTKNSRGMDLGWTENLPEPTIEGPTATYKAVMPDIDLQVTALVDGFTHTLVVKTPEAAANPDLDAIDMPISTDGTKVETAADGGIEVIDTASGGTLLEADSPTMWDSSSEEQPRLAKVDADVSRNVITLTPDQALLDSPKTEFPLYIDPVYRDSYRSKWAMVDSGYPNESYYKFDGEKHEGLGYCDFANCNRSTVKRLLYTVSSSAYRGKIIIKAEFAVTAQHYAYDSASHKIDLYLFDRGISSETTWNSKKDEWDRKVDTRSGPSSASSSCSNSSSHATEFDVSDEVADAAKDRKSALTFGMRNDNESSYNSWMRFCDNGTLRVKYNTRPDTPDTSTMGMKHGKACSYELGESSYTSKPPELFATLNDDDHGKSDEWGGDEGGVSEKLQPQFKLFWGDGKEWESKLQPAKAAGGQFTLNLDPNVSGAPTLPHNTPIGWIVRAYDGYSYSAWSWEGDATRCRFVIDPTVPEAPTVASTDFEDGDEINTMVGKTGKFTLDSPSPDVTSYTFDFNKDESGPRTTKPDSPGAAVTVPYLPTVPGRHLLTVVAFDAAKNRSSSTVYSFRVSVPDPSGSWSLADETGSGSVADVDGTNPGTPGLGVELGVQGPSALTAATFDGTSNAYITTQKRGRVPTRDSFAAGSWVRVDDLSRDQTIVSVNGSGEAGFVLGYDSTSGTTGRWILSTPDMDVTSYRDWRITGGTVNASNQDGWVHVLGTYDSRDRALRLYVNGKAVTDESRSSDPGDSVARRSLWNATNTVQIGRSLDAGNYGHFFAGDLADVRVFDRLVVPDEAEYLGTVMPRRTAYWQLNSASGTSSPEYLNQAPMSLQQGAAIFNGSPDDEPVLGSGHLELNGTTGFATTGESLIDTRKSFSVVTRARPTAVTAAHDMTVMALRGNATNLVEIKYAAELDAWQLVVASADNATAEKITIEHQIPPSADAHGQSLAVTYDAFTGQLSMWVNGVVAERNVESFTTSWPITDIQLGRGFGDDSFFSGAIDDTRVYNGSCYPSMIADLSIPHELPDL